MRILFILLATIFAISASAAEWGAIQQTVGGNSVDITSSGKKIGLVWPNKVVPGDELLLIQVTYETNQETFYHSYQFLGISGGSLHLRVTGAIKGRGSKEARTSESMEQLLYIEPANDGAFYFVQKDLVGEATLKVEKNLQAPGTYRVNIQRTGR